MTGVTAVSNRLAAPIWLTDYRREWLFADVTAGATVWAVLVPLAMASAILFGVGPVVGLYALPLPLLAYAFFGGTRLLVIGPDTAVAVLVGGIVASLAVSSDEMLTLTIALAVMAGAFYILFYFLRMGWIADLIPEPVLKGFIEGVVWLTILKQFKDLLGLKLEGPAEGFYGLLIAVVKALPGLHVGTALLGIACVFALYLLKRFAPRVPGSIIVLVLSIAFVATLGLAGSGVDVVGRVEGGLPDLGWPASLNIDRVISLVPGAIAVVVLGYTKTLAALRRATQETGELIDPDRELLGLGVSNLGAGLSGGYAVAGSLTATSVGIASGAKSQVANLVACALCVLTILILLPLLANLAFATLAAIIVIALSGLSDIGYFRELWHERRGEFVIGLAAFIGVLAFGVMPGVLIGVILALFALAGAVHSPTTAMVGRTSAGAFVDLDDRPEAEEVVGMLIWRMYGPAVFLNARALSNKLREAAATRPDLKVVVLDATAVAGVDTSAAHGLLAVRDELAARDIQLWIVNIRRKGWTLIETMMKEAGKAVPSVFDSLAEAVDHFERAPANTPSAGSTED
jgi:SulP family sulfate permease